MGEVYLAEDTNLKRQVAIKVLPQQFALDKERLARFEREARLLASLNHPNIATIHGLEKSDGQHFLVMELVEGDTLAERINKGPLPVDEALKVCCQIAEGLESAHEKGIIHRDLKPSNVKVTPEGKVKILDFGIAKAFQDQTSESDLTKSPAITDEMTQPGVILGTAAYMSPEQAKGKTVDKRVDIWAFGCILFECLTGKRAFRGDTISEMMASILKDEVEWKDLPKTTPLKVRELIARCLIKDERNRIHAIADVRIVIQECLVPGSELIIQPQRTEQSKFSWKSAAVIAIAFALGSVATYLFVQNRSQIVSPSTRAKFEMMLEPNRIAVSNTRPSLAISPDGSQLVYTALDENGQTVLMRRNFKERTQAAIIETEGGICPFFSPDGQWLAFTADGKLKKVRLDGGAPEVLCDASVESAGSWGPNGTIVFMPVSGESLWQVSESGGKAEKLSRVDRAHGEVSHFGPNFLPDGSGVLFSIFHGENTASLGLLDLETKRHQNILPGVQHTVYSSTGHLIYTRADTMYARPFDLKTHSFSGQEFTLIRDVYVTTFNRGQFSLSNTGTLAYISGTPRPCELIMVDLEGKTIETVPAEPMIYGRPKFSRDGTKIAVQIRDLGFTRSWIADRESGRLVPIISKGNTVRPLWTPDGERITYVSDRSGPGQWKLYWESIKDAKVEVLLENRVSGRNEYNYVWSKDGRFLVVACNLLSESGDTAERGNAVAYLDLESPGELREVIPSRHPMHRYSLALSPDGCWLAYEEVEAERKDSAQVWVTPFPEGGRRIMVSKGGGRTPIWSPDGNRIYYFSTTPGVLSVQVVDIRNEPEFLLSQPRQLFECQDTWFSGRDWDLSPDGQYFVVVRSVGEEQWSPPSHINIDMDFFHLIREKAKMQ
jgi:serine/threonine-protein kinase